MGCSSSKPEEPTFVDSIKTPPPASPSPTTPMSPPKGLLKTEGSSGSLNGGITFSPGTVFPEQLQCKQAMMIPVPSGHRTGDQLLVETPDGRKTAVIIPAGAKSGQLFQANLPTRRVSSEMSPKHDPALKQTASSPPSSPSPEATKSANGGSSPAMHPVGAIVTVARSVGKPVVAVVRGFDATTGKYTLEMGAKGDGAMINALQDKVTAYDGGALDAEGDTEAVGVDEQPPAAAPSGQPHERSATPEVATSTSTDSAMADSGEAVAEGGDYV